MRYIARKLLFYVVAAWAAITLNFPVCQKPPPDLPAGTPGHLNRCWLCDPEVMAERREGAPTLCDSDRRLQLQALAGRLPVRWQMSRTR